MLFDVKRFAINDGPGIRVTLFMKGCPLRCVWCHNPEGIMPRKELLFTEKKCLGCNSCVEECPLHIDPRRAHDDERCRGCGRCAEACPTRALEVAGREWSVDEILRLVEKEREVITESGGGVTLCGGEPLMHPEETLAILKALGEHGIHRAVDTSLYVKQNILQKVAEETDLFLVDLKHMDDAMHRRFTGVCNTQILSNIEWLSLSNCPFWIRIPVIDGVNCDEENVRSSARFLAALPHKPELVCLLSYHDIGKGKHARRGTTYNPDNISMQPPTKEHLALLLRVFEEEGLNVRVGG